MVTTLLADVFNYLNIQGGKYKVYKRHEMVSCTTVNGFCIRNQGRNLLIQLKIKRASLQTESRVLVITLTIVKVFLRIFTTKLS